MNGLPLPVQSYSNKLRDIVNVIGRENIKMFIPLDSSDEDGYARDLFIPGLKFRPRGGAVVGNVAGLLGRATHFNGVNQYLEEVPITGAHDSSSSERKLDSGIKIFAQRLEPKTFRLGMARMYMTLIGTLPSATLKMTLREDNAGIPGPIRATSDTLECSLVTTTQQWRGFNFPTIYDVVRTVGNQHPSPGNSIKYFWLCLEYDTSTGVDTNNCIAIKYQQTSTYGNPRAEYNGSTWTVTNDQHFSFDVYSDWARLPKNDMSVIAFLKLDDYDNATRLDSNAFFTQKGMNTMSIECTMFRGNNCHMDLNGGALTTAIPIYDSDWHIFGLTHDASDVFTYGYADGLQRAQFSKSAGTSILAQGGQTSIGNAMFFQAPGIATPTNPFTGIIGGIIVTSSALSAAQHAAVAAIARII